MVHSIIFWNTNYTKNAKKILEKMTILRFVQNKSDTILLQPKMCNDVLLNEVDQNLNRLYDGVFHRLVVYFDWIHWQCYKISIASQQMRLVKIIIGCWSIPTSSFTT